MNRIVSWGVRKVNRPDRLTLQVVTFILLHLIIHVAHQFSRRASFLLHPVQHSEKGKRSGHDHRTRENMQPVVTRPGPCMSVSIAMIWDVFCHIWKLSYKREYEYMYMYTLDSVISQALLARIKNKGGVLECFFPLG